MHVNKVYHTKLADKYLSDGGCTCVDAEWCLIWLQRKNDSASQEKQKPPEPVQEEDVQLEDDDYALLAEFGDRIDFLTGAAPVQQELGVTPRKRCAPV